MVETEVDDFSMCPAIRLPKGHTETERDNGMKSSKMKRKRQIMLRDLNWISRHVCEWVSILGGVNWRWP